jgi:hypothetical protein
VERSIVLPRYILEGITHKSSSLQKNIKIFGGDTETCDGKPITLQICSDNLIPELFWVTPKTILPVFLAYCEAHVSQGETGVFYFHNLDFDLVALLYGTDLSRFRDTEFSFVHRNWRLNIFCGKRYFAKLKRGHKKQVYIIDSGGFLPFSLKKIAEELRLPVKKLPPPEGLGEKNFKPEDKEFTAYALNDSLVQFHVGKWIYDLHEKFDIKISVSLPQFAGYLFRSQFLRSEDCIELPPTEIIRAALLSYHGGKNGMYVPPGRYENCSEIDLNSAYAFAMKNLPSFLEGEYKEVDSYTPGYEGIFCVTGETECPYGVIFNHDFKPIHGKFQNIWTTSYELAEALAHGEVKIRSCRGYVWIPESIRNPFGEYVDYFYAKKKETPKTNSLYTFYKLGMNTLYGKTIQAVEVVNEETRASDYETEIDKAGKLKVKRINKSYRAGGLFNPFIATLITGKVRAMIHSMEHKFKALHTATDSVKTQLPITGESGELGGYKLEVKGDCLLFRNKLYLHYDGKMSDNKLVKFALHGFMGKASNLLDLYQRREQDYKVDHLFKIKEALIQKQVPLKMTKALDRALKIDWRQFRENGTAPEKT